jgi:hypothetical protein
MKSSLAVLRYSWQSFGPVSPGFQDAQFNEIFGSRDWPLGVSRFWYDTTLGTLDCTAGARVFPWRVLPLNQDLFFNPKTGNIESPHSRYEIRDVALDHADEDFEIEKFSAIAIFMYPNPSDAAALQQGEATTVLDWGGEESYMAHELGHALMFEHSGAPDGTDYGDPYCIMSYRNCRTYPGTASDPGLPALYYQRCGPMASAAHVYWTIGEFKASASVVHVPPDARDTHRSITLKAFSEAALGDPVLAVFEVDGQTWTAEYRVPTNWDDGIGNGALVFHTIRYPPATGQTAAVRYAGDLRVPFDRGMRDWRPPSPLNATDLAAVVERADETHITFSFGHQLDHSVSLDREKITLGSRRGPESKQTFPVRNGLCGEQEFTTYWVTTPQRMKLEAHPLGYVDPVFKWKVNGVDVVLPNPALAIQTTTWIDDGLTVKPGPPSNALLICRNYDDATPPNTLPPNQLWLENDSPQNIIDVTVEVDVSDQGPRPPSATAASVPDQFEGSRRVIVGKDEADRKCKEYWDQIGDKLPESELWKRIDKGDPVWHVVEAAEHAKSEREKLVGLVALARASQSREPKQASELASALALRLKVPERLITG